MKLVEQVRHGGARLSSQLLGRLKQENCLNLEGGGYSELRLCHCTLAWVTEQDSSCQKQANKRKDESLTFISKANNLIQ